MTIEEQFQKVLQRAIDNGWDICGFLNDANCEKWSQGIHQWQNVVDLEIYLHGHKRIVQADTIYFNHEFAQAFWQRIHPTDDHAGIDWKWHLQKLAVLPTDERLDYLYNFVKGGESHASSRQ